MSKFNKLVSEIYQSMDNKPISSDEAILKAIPDIDWEIGDRYDSAGDGYVFFHHIDGYSPSTGRYFQASAAVMDDSIEEIEDIEEVDESGNVISRVGQVKI